MERRRELPVRLQRGAEEVLLLGDGGAGAESQLSLVMVLMVLMLMVLVLSLQWRVERDGHLLHRRRLERKHKSIYLNKCVF